MDHSEVEHTTQFIRKLVAEDLSEVENGQRQTAPLMMQVPFEEVQQLRLQLRQFIVYLKSPEAKLDGERPVDRLSHDEMKRLAWLYERLVKRWLEQAEHDMAGS